MFEEDVREPELFEHFHIVADKGQSQIRIDKFLHNRIENASRTRIQNAADAGNILVNNNPVRSNYKVKPGDIISIVLTFPPRDEEIIPEDIPLEIIYEDGDIVVINKAAGMVVHPAYANFTGTLVNALYWRYKDLELFKRGDIRPGLVHRIDKNTSGIIVVAKNEQSLNKLARQFFDHSIDRHYVALVWGNLKEEEGTISGFIGRSIRDRKIMSVYENETQGKTSVTHYKVIERLGYVNLIDCKLETGRTHQIRAHFKHIGHPLFNDSEYGGDKILKGTTFSKYKQFVENCFKIIPRQALHAKSLAFNHPVSGERLFFDSDLPSDLKEVIGKWRNYIAEGKNYR